MKHIKKLLTIITLFFLSLSISSCTGTLSPDTFDDYTKDLFITLLGNDELTISWLINNPTNYGLEEHYEPALPTPSSGSALGKLVVNLYFGKIKRYNYEELNFDQKMTYNVIINLLDKINNSTAEMDYLSSDYLGSYLGYQAQLPLLLSEYNFNDRIDLDNYFTFLDLVPETFKAYVDFEIQKADAGFGMPDFVIDKVINQCIEFTSEVENHFLIKTFESRINNLSFIDKSEIPALIEKNHEKVTGPLYNGYLYVKEHLAELKGRATNNLGLAHYNIGKEYYALLFKQETGYDVTVEEAISYIDGKINDSLAALRAITAEHPEVRSEASSVNLLNNLSPEALLEKYKTDIINHFPVIHVYPAINVKHIDPAMENHFSPAAYMTSPIDDLSNEYIYLNDAEIGSDYNYLYTTLAHEGIAGHLYQNIYFKSTSANPIRKALKNSGYTEGWATYAQMYSYNFCDESIPSYVLNYLKANDELIGAINSRLDMGIHYEGWDADQTLTFLNSYLQGYTKERAQLIVEQLVEIPTNSQVYYFTYFKIVDMYNKAKTALGNNFNEVDFHKIILDAGAVPLKYIEVLVDEYIANNTI